MLMNLLAGVYSSFKVLRLRRSSASGRQDKLAFWTVFAAMSLYGQYLEPWLSWAPFYYWAKVSESTPLDRENKKTRKWD